MSKLPTTLSGLLLLAVHDMRAMKKDKRYVFNAWTYHAPSASTEKCHACMAGAVMRGTLHCSPKRSILPCDLRSSRAAKAMGLIDGMRCGYIEEVYSDHMGRPPVSGSPMRRVSMGTNSRSRTFARYWEATCDLSPRG